MKKVRYEFLDQLKGIAVILMILFHISFDFIYFGFISASVKREFYWYVQPKIIITLFLLSVGMSLCIVHKDKVRWSNFVKRSTKLLLLASLVSIATYFVFPQNWVYFGVLHNILISSLLALPFLKRPNLSLFLGLTLVFPSVFFNYKYPSIELSRSPVDHVALFPWFGIVLIGIYLHSINVHLANVPEYRFKRSISFLGRNSLEVYMTHQLILFPLVFLLYKLVNP